ncbi:M4 family metallopeptidase [Sulfitobacter aestuarii]|uniref:Neutral metalloproteinase n=1 Tax=Sulfitobacter aestuarii TaxID=2161676 RepID=A0ABW5U2I0_9RHOB
MCQCHASPGPRQPINCIVPPYMLEVLAMRGDAKTAKAARAQLELNEKARRERQDRQSLRMTPQSTLPTFDFVTPALSQATMQRNLDRAVHDGEQKAALPGKLVRKEGDPPTGDVDVDRVYDGAGHVYDLYFTHFQRDSLDGLGMKLVQTVHHRKNYSNAFWNGEQMAYGDGDGEIFSTFTELSVIGHELSHGVVQFSGGLVYQGQSGALNESFADVFGIMAKQHALGESVDDSDWLVGKGILGPEINGVALRSMRAPGTAYADAVLGQDPQPYHMDFYMDTTSDNGGVHINSGIPNHAFYLYCQYLGGNAWAKPGQIWYHALQRLNNPLASFHDWAGQTVSSAMELHGIGSLEVNLLRRAWKLVGIQV